MGNLEEIQKKIKNVKYMLDITNQDSRHYYCLKLRLKALNLVEQRLINNIEVDEDTNI